MRSAGGIRRFPLSCSASGILSLPEEMPASNAAILEGGGGNIFQRLASEEGLVQVIAHRTRIDDWINPALDKNHAGNASSRGLAYR